MSAARRSCLTASSACAFRFACNTTNAQNNNRPTITRSNASQSAPHLATEYDNGTSALVLGVAYRSRWLTERPAHLVNADFMYLALPAVRSQAPHDNLSVPGSNFREPIFSPLALGKATHLPPFHPSNTGRRPLQATAAELCGSTPHHI